MMHQGGRQPDQELPAEIHQSLVLTNYINKIKIINNLYNMEKYVAQMLEQPF